MTELRKKSWPRMASWTITFCTAGSAPSAASARTSDGRDELRRLLVDLRQQARRQRGIGIALEIRIGDVAEAIVGIVHHAGHHRLHLRIAKSGEQHERAEADVAVLVLRRGLDQAPARPAPPARAARCATPACGREIRASRACRSRPSAL